MEVQDEVTATGTAPLVDKDLVAQLVGDAQRLGLSVEGEGGLLAQLTKLVLESALEGEMTAHLGYDKHERVEGSENARNGTRSKTVLTKAGPVEIAVPRDRAGSFEPVVVAKRQRRLGAIEDVVLSLSARGLTHGDIAAHLADVYGSEVSKTTISTITDKVLDSMGEWQNRPLDPVYPVLFIDAIHVKVRDGQVANRPIYVALAVTVDGHRDILGLWAGDAGEGAKYWQQVLTEIKNRGVTDVLMLVCDGLEGLPESVGNVWPQTIVRLWENAWPEFVPFLQFDKEIRRIVCTTNAIESVNARIRKAVKARGHFPNEQAALKCVYLAVMALDPTGKGRARWTQRWKGALNAFEITFDGRLSAGRRY
ncbi:IS256 family transposase [Tessaracoccus lacteus]|uniref:Mutator family transposase n=1 Tax=Tessaracoccus lacteus TaxID=3041766 RepID=A0ABY8Q173_9ACTN|nr:IS256 family transposase [Tessaracoccus sp. T21]WGT48580.1 IS256 family transposase [Tessaracoccus sp. T21]